MARFRGNRISKRSCWHSYLATAVSVNAHQFRFCTDIFWLMWRETKRPVRVPMSSLGRKLNDEWEESMISTDACALTAMLDSLVGFFFYLHCRQLLLHVRRGIEREIFPNVTDIRNTENLIQLVRIDFLSLLSEFLTMNLRKDEIIVCFFHFDWRIRKCKFRKKGWGSTKKVIFEAKKLLQLPAKHV